eukprot:1196317-Prorocentrum_minimum.AAC.3
MGEPRFEVIYDLVAPSEPEARSKARDICIEQTVEVPPSVVEGTWIGDEIVGRIEELTPRGMHSLRTVCSTVPDCDRHRQHL